MVSTSPRISAGQPARRRREAVRRAAAAQHRLGQALRHRLDHRAHPIEWRAGGRGGRVLSAQQEVHQHAERVDVGGGGHVASLQLFGRGEFGRERVARAGGERGLRVAAGVVQQLGDAEVQQLHVAARGDEDVARFQVAVQDQPVVRLRDRAQHVQHQAQARIDGEREAAAVLVDRLAVDVFEHEVGLRAVGHDTGIEQACDVRMRQAREDAAFALEAFGVALAEQARAQELDRDLAFVAAVVATRQPHGAHAAMADLAHQRVRADRLAGQAARLGQRRLRHELAAFDRGQVLQHRADGLGELRIPLAQREQARGALVVGQVQQFVEQGRQLAPGLLADRHQRVSVARAAMRAFMNSMPRTGTAVPCANRAAPCAR